MSAADKDQRTLPPTQRRIDEFRKRGEIATSRDLTATATMAGGALIGAMYVQDSASAHLDHFRSLLGDIGSERIGTALSEARGVYATAVTPLIVGAFGGCLLAGAVQLGWPPALSALKFDPIRPLTFQNAGKIFSPGAAMGRLARSGAKFAAVLAAAAWAIMREFQLLVEDPSPTAIGLAKHLGATMWRLAGYSGAALALLAAVEYFQAHRALAAKMKMTPEEFKREHREQEGDPQVKRRRRQRMRELAQRRLETTVKTADVVLVNPTEYAVALRYRGGEDRAPRVLAKGRGLIAERIRELARKAGIPILAQPPLTRLIHKLVPEGREIPPDLYHAVAEVLAYVYRLRARTA